MVPRGTKSESDARRPDMHSATAFVSFPARSAAPPLTTTKRINRRAPWSLKMKASTSLPLALGLVAVATVGAFAPARTNSRSAAAPLAVTLEGRQIAEGGDLKPVNNFVLVKVAEIQDKTDSGILLTGSVSFVLCFRLCPCNRFEDE